MPDYRIDNIHKLPYMRDNCRPNNIHARAMMKIHNINIGIYRISPTQMYLYSNRLNDVLFKKNIDNKLKDKIYRFILNNKKYNRLAKIYAFITDNTDEIIDEYFIVDCNSSFSLLKENLFKK